MFLKVEAQDLRPEDFCIGSRTRILGPPVSGVHTPAGKVELKVQRKNGDVVYVTWNRRTKIGIERTWTT